MQRLNPAIVYRWWAGKKPFIGEYAFSFCEGHRCPYKTTVKDGLNNPCQNCVFTIPNARITKLVNFLNMDGFYGKDGS